MKSFGIIPLLLYLFLSMIGYSQEAHQMEYLFSLKKPKVTDFGGVNVEFSLIDGKFAYSSGRAGALLFNYNTFLGAYSYSLNTQHKFGDV